MSTDVDLPSHEVVSEFQLACDKSVHFRVSSVPAPKLRNTPKKKRRSKFDFELTSEIDPLPCSKKNVERKK